MTLIRRLFFLSIVTAVFALVLLPSGQACTIDGKPSASANGTRAVLTRDAYNSFTASGQTWALFSFAGHYRAKAPIQFAEDQAQLRIVLSCQALDHPWRWEFGDGQHAVGWRVIHRYAHPGTYRMTVLAYYPSYHQFISFDSVRIFIR